MPLLGLRPASGIQIGAQASATRTYPGWIQAVDLGTDTLWTGGGVCTWSVTDATNPEITVTVAPAVDTRYCDVTIATTGAVVLGFGSGENAFNVTCTNGLTGCIATYTVNIVDLRIIPPGTNKPDTWGEIYYLTANPSHTYVFPTMFYLTGGSGTYTVTAEGANGRILNPVLTPNPIGGVKYYDLSIQASNVGWSDIDNIIIKADDGAGLQQQATFDFLVSPEPGVNASWPSALTVASSTTDLVNISAAVTWDSRYSYYYASMDYIPGVALNVTSGSGAATITLVNGVGTITAGTYSTKLKVTVQFNNELYYIEHPYTVTIAPAVNVNIDISPEHIYTTTTTTTAFKTVGTNVLVTGNGSLRYSKQQVAADGSPLTGIETTTKASGEFWPLRLADDSNGTVYKNSLGVTVDPSTVDTVYFKFFAVDNPYRYKILTVHLNSAYTSNYVVTPMFTQLIIDGSNQNLPITTTWNSPNNSTNPKGFYSYDREGQDFGSLAVSGSDPLKATYTAPLILSQDMYAHAVFTPYSDLDYKDTGMVYKQAEIFLTDTPTNLALNILPTVVPDGTVGSSYSVTFSLDTGNPPTNPVSWSITGSVPPGLSFNSATATLAGIPTGSTSNYNFVVHAVDSSVSPKTGTKNCGITITNTSFAGLLTSITPSSSLITNVTPAHVTITGNFALVSATDTFAFTSSSLPVGVPYKLLDLTQANWNTPNQISNVIIPSWDRAETVNLQFYRSGSLKTTLTSCYTYNSAIPNYVITNISPTTHYANTNFSTANPFVLSFNVPPPEIVGLSTLIITDDQDASNASATLPTAQNQTLKTLTFENINTYNTLFNVLATNTIYPKTYSLYVAFDLENDGPPYTNIFASQKLTVRYAPLAIETQTLPVAIKSSSYTTALSASGGSDIKTWAITAGSLPDGITLSSSGNLTGIPTVTGTFNITLRVTSTKGSIYTESADKQYTLVVNDVYGSTLTITTTTLPPGRINETYPWYDPQSQLAILPNKINISGGIPPYTLSITAQSLPIGLLLSPTALTSVEQAGYYGEITGIPTNANVGDTTYPFTVTVTDNSAQRATASKNLSIYLYGPFSTVTLSGINPTSGPKAGATLVTLTGTDFRSGATVLFGKTTNGITNKPATEVTFVSNTSMTCKTPAFNEFSNNTLVDVIILNPDGSTDTLTDGFTYLADNTPRITTVLPLDGPYAGGQTVVITGSSLTGVSKVQFGIGSGPSDYATATAFQINSDTQITCTTPAYTAPSPLDKKDVNIVLTKPSESGNLTATYPGVDGWTQTSGYRYRPAPVITAVIPNQGPTSGGNTVYVTGKYFFNSRPAGLPPTVKIGDIELPAGIVTLVEE